MRIDLAHDRLDHHPDRYCDPVVTRVGVFAQIEEEALSDAERARCDKADERAGEALEKAAKVWTPKAILKRVTNLYARFAKPEGGAP